MNGLLVLDKPAGMTSRDAVNRVMKALPRGTRVGHTGTLDPLATGVLALCVGQATRLAEYVQEMDKEYRAVVTLGAVSDTDDADGQIRPTPGAAPVSEASLREALADFVGTLHQAPPAYSAVKIDGRRAHARARQGEDVRPEARSVVVYGIDLLEYAWPIARLRVSCGKGTYIRSIARDLGQKLGVGGYISELRRTRVGPFRAEAAISITASTDEIVQSMRPMADALAALPRVVLPSDCVPRFRQGQAVAAAASGEIASPRLSAVFLAEGTLVGIGLHRPDGMVEPRKNLQSVED